MMVINKWQFTLIIETMEMKKKKTFEAKTETLPKILVIKLNLRD